MIPTVLTISTAITEKLFFVPLVLLVPLCGKRTRRLIPKLFAEEGGDLPGVDRFPRHLTGRVVPTW